MTHKLYPREVLNLHPEFQPRQEAHGERFGATITPTEFVRLYGPNLAACLLGLDDLMSQSVFPDVHGVHIAHGETTTMRIEELQPDALDERLAADMDDKPKYGE